VLQFRKIVQANDAKMNACIKLASLLGIEGRNWTSEWKDGGRAIFSFDTPERRDLFAFYVVLLDI
jgi:hypothetical protein